MMDLSASKITINEIIDYLNEDTLGAQNTTAQEDFDQDQTNCKVLDISHAAHYFQPQTTWKLEKSQHPQSNQVFVNRGPLNLVIPRKEENMTIAAVPGVNNPVQQMRQQSELNIFSIKPDNTNTVHMPPIVRTLPSCNIYTHCPPIQSSSTSYKQGLTTSQKGLQYISQSNFQVSNTDLTNRQLPKPIPSSFISQPKNHIQSNEVIRWNEIDNIKFPYVSRVKGNFMSVRIAEIKFLSQFANNVPSELKQNPPLKSTPITKQEASMMDVVNEECNYEYGLVSFRNDLIVDLEEFKQFYYSIKKFCDKEQKDKNTTRQHNYVTLMNSGETDAIKTFNSVCAGWMQIHNTVSPYIARVEGRYIPSFVIKHTMELKIEDQSFSVLPTSDECKYLNVCCKFAGLNFSFDNNIAFTALANIIHPTSKRLYTKDLPLDNPFAHVKYDLMLEKGTSVTGTEICDDLLGTSSECKDKKNYVTIIESSEMQATPPNINAVMSPQCNMKSFVNSSKSSAMSPVSNPYNHSWQARNQVIQSSLGRANINSDHVTSIGTEICELHGTSSERKDKKNDVTIIGSSQMQATYPNINGVMSPQCNPSLQASNQMIQSFLECDNINNDHVPDERKATGFNRNAVPLSQCNDKKPVGKISSVTIRDKTILVIKRMDGQNYVLLECLSRIFCPNQDISEFIDTVEKLIPVKLINCTEEEEIEFIRIYNLQRNSLRCHKMIQINKFEDYLPLLENSFKQDVRSVSDGTEFSNTEIIAIKALYEEGIFQKKLDLQSDGQCIFGSPDYHTQALDQSHQRKARRSSNQSHLFTKNVHCFKRNIRRNNTNIAWKQSKLKKANENQTNKMNVFLKLKDKGEKKQQEIDSESEEIPVKKCKLCLIDIVKENLCYEICNIFGITFRS